MRERRIIKQSPALTGTVDPEIAIRLLIPLRLAQRGDVPQPQRFSGGIPLLT